MTKEEKHKVFSNLKFKGETYPSSTSQYPTVFYMGKGKTGSSALVRGIEQKTAHWHSTWYFEHVNRHYELSKHNLTMYDFVEWINETIHPVVVIEAYRDPIAQYFSALRQWHTDKMDISQAEAMLVDKMPQITFQKEIEKPNSPLKVIYLKAEDSHLWEKKLAHYGVTYHDDRINVSSNAWHDKLSKVKFPYWFLDIIYKHKKVQTLYTDEEIQGFYEKWGSTSNRY